MSERSNESTIPLAVALSGFRSVLVHGKYPSSAPLHCSLSHFSSSSRGLDPGTVARPILITGRGRQALIKDLINENDEWLNANSGLGTTASVLSRIRILYADYPPTPDHCVFLFSLLQHGVPQGPVPVLPNPNIHLDPPVSLIVLHEPSAYFLDSNQHKPYTLHSYLRLVTSALTLVQSLSTAAGTPAFAVFDSRIDELALPVLSITQGDPIADESEEMGTSETGDTKALPAVAKYFEQTGRIEGGAELTELAKQHMFSAKLGHGTTFPLYYWNWRPVRFD
ncbi:hypothetical protein BU17DRAFT_80136 [Hysterangium stoloniferum]|nr:hypothetical protein BU17DRAFT_80136 [Hysterangium stoloniferum]